MKEIVVEGCDVTSKNKFPLDDNAVNGAVVDGEVKIRAMTLTGDLVQVELPVLCATLKPNYFNSKFWTDSTATVTAFIDGARVTRIIPVDVHGSIRENDGTYFLDAEVRGVLKTSVENEEDDSESHGYGGRGRHGSRHHHVTTTDTITTFKVVLCAQATVPPLTVMATATASCRGAQPNGTAEAVAAGGTGPYSYTWSNGATTASISGLTASTYSVTVTDANGDTAMATAMVVQAGFITLDVTTTPVTGRPPNGTASAVPFGANGPFTYLWSNGETTATITGLSPGFYTVTVIDADGCTATATAEVMVDAS